MKLSKIIPLALLTVSIVSVAQAHPGHDGHELVWDYTGGHIHLDWMIWTALGILTAIGCYRYVKSRG
jgi:hypothetical protein